MTVPRGEVVVPQLGVVVGRKTRQGDGVNPDVTGQAVGAQIASGRSASGVWEGCQSIRLTCSSPQPARRAFLRNGPAQPAGAAGPPIPSMKVIGW